jgi:CHAT domain-containing protein
MDTLMSLGRATDAFHVLERARARSFLSLLAERDWMLQADIPPELEKERRLANADYDSSQSALAALSPVQEPVKVENLGRHLRDLREKRQDIIQRIRTASPRLASLRYPRPLGLDAIQASLDPGTVLLSYSVAEHQTLLFVVARPRSGKSEFQAVALPIGEKQLREKVEGFRSLIQQSPAAGPALARGQELFDLLVRPAASLIAKSSRVLIVPDGPLHALPFGALVDGKARGTSRIQFLVEWKPIHVALSGTVYAGLLQSRPAADHSWPIQMAAFGDPQYTSTGRPPGLMPLPSSRDEVEAITSLQRGKVLKYLGREATEEHAKALGFGIRYIHFASHALLNERFPLDSGLALSRPEEADEGNNSGLWRVWEILEGLRLDADLVTLSACESALGAERGGEGLLGLTRAFQYAGARSILASLWAVPDDSTAQFMGRFYRFLNDGLSKDQALRAAQLESLRRPEEAAAPFRWAAFQLMGDWK